MDNSDSRLARLLFSNGPASDRADKMGLYGWLIGDWTMDAVMHAPNGETHERRGEIGFAWVLEGRIGRRRYFAERGSQKWRSGRWPAPGS
jgi:hypothetical protein